MARTFSQRTGKAGDGVVHFGAMRIEADLYLLDAEAAKLLRFAFADHDRVRFDFDIEQQLTRVGDQFQKVAAEKNLSTAKG